MSTMSNTQEATEGTSKPAPAAGKGRGKSKQPAEEARKLRVLMIHGYRQSEAAFRERSGSLRKALKSSCEFIFCEAPHLVPPLEASDLDLAQLSLEPEEKAAGEDTTSNTAAAAAVEKGWWFSAENDSYVATERTSCQKGFDESLAYLNEVFKQNAPIDGVIGFSQGGCLLGMLCAIAERPSEWPQLDAIRFKFSILVAAFKSGQEQHDQFYSAERPVAMPSLHVMGRTDKVIPFEMSQSLTGYFKEPQVLEHELGHFIPVNGDAKKAYQDFLSRARAAVVAQA